MVNIYANETATTISTKYHCHLLGTIPAPKLLKEFRLYRRDHGNDLDRHFFIFILKLLHGEEDVDLGLKSFIISSRIASRTGSLPTKYFKDRGDVVLHVVHNSLRNILQLLSVSLHQIIAVHPIETIWSQHFVIDSFCRNTPNGRERSSVKHGYLFARCLTEIENTSELREGATRDSWKMECPYEATKTSMKQCEKLHLKAKTREAWIKRAEAQSILEWISILLASMYAMKDFFDINELA